MMAGLGAGIWRNVDELKQVRTVDRTFTSTTAMKDRRERMKTWRKAVKRARNWID